MKLGISSYTFAWAIGLPGATPSHPMKPLQLLEKARELGVGLVQFGPNMPLDKIPDYDLREVLKRANLWRIDLEVVTEGIDPWHLREQMKFAKRIGAILLKTTPEHPVGQIPVPTEIASCLRAVAGDLADKEICLAIDNSRIPAQDLNELLGTIRSPWLGAAIDTANPLVLLQGYQVSVRVLGHRTLSLQIKDVVVHPEVHGMGLSITGCPVGKGKLNVAWLVESFASLRIEPSAILESWTPAQKSLDETIALEEAWAKQGVDYLRRFISD